MDPAAEWAAQLILKWLREGEPDEVDALFTNERVRVMRVERVVLLHDLMTDERSGRAYVDEDEAVSRFTQTLLRYTFPGP